MSKLTPIILAAIMLASTSLVALDWAELENKSMTEADGRSGPDAKVTDMLSPRATSVDSMTGEKTNTLDAGEDVQFEVYIENIGDVDIEEMGISLTIYYNVNGSRGNVATDAAGNPLSWTNGDVVCDDTFVCPWSTLASTSTLNYGRYTFAYQGSPITWTPITGDYVIVVSTDALNDANPGNDYAEQFVSVTDWYDVVVDLAWDSGKNVESGTDSKGFTLSVETEGSTPWSLRNLTLQLEVSGMVSSASDNNGNDILGVSQVSDIGTYSIVEVFRHETQPNNISNDSRYVIDSQTTAEWSGYLSPDGSVTQGGYSVSVNLVEFVAYGQFTECEETLSTNNSNNTDPNATIDDETYLHFCEVAFSTDANAATSEDLIEGYIQTFHDIGVSDLVINQGYDTDENGDRSETPNMPGFTSGPLNPAWSSVQASVRHFGSDLFITYDWKVTFDIQNTITGVTSTVEADNCTFGQGPEYREHKLLGDSMVAASAFETGEACVWFEFVPGIYNISATISMVGESVSDMNIENDEMDINYAYSLNNRPSVTLTIPQNSVVIGPDALITLEADAFDADDETGESLSYVWTHPGLIANNGTVQPSPCNGLGPSFSTCSLLAYDSEWVGTRVYSVTVSDEFGSSAMDFTNFFVWNHVIATDTTNSGITMEYNLTYNGVNEFMISLEDSSISYTQDLSDFGYAGEYSSVAVLDYAPSTTYLASDVHDQEIEIHYDASSITPVGVFWVSSNFNWVELSSNITEAGSDGRIILDWGGDNQVLPQGEIVLMGGVLQVIEVPTAHPMGLTVIAQKGGTIAASWNYMGNTLPGDVLRMEICDSAGACDTEDFNISIVAHYLNGQTDTTHGETYTYTLWLCNIAGCNTNQYASASATADSMVDGSPGTSGVYVMRSNDSESWIISWDIFGDTSDVSGWMTCYADYSWSSLGEMPTNNCYVTSDEDISYPNGFGNKVYYFTVFAYDDKGNMMNGLPQTYINHDHSITYSATDSDSDGVDDDFDLCPDTEQGLEVDSEGCPIDYDEDNYLNSIDDCPYVYGTSNKGQQTNRLVGCPDSDGDGWADSIDAFPNNSSEWLDNDNDGCGNNIDEFPNDPEECVDSDEDGVGDNSDLFPEDPEESSDKDGDGVGDSKDKCDSTKDGASIGKDGCETEDESSGLVTGLAIGIGILSVIVIALLIVVFISRSRNVENDSDDFDDSMSYNQTEFVQQEFYQQEQTMQQPISKDVPQVHDTGNLDANGYEWIEYPSGSGIWYWRQSRGAGWTKHQ